MAFLDNKIIALDLSKLKDLYCGLGQFSFNFASTIINNNKIKLFFCISSSKNKYWMNINYYLYSWINKFIKPTIKVDLWHAIHQDSSFLPSSGKYILTIHDLNFIYEKNAFKSKRNLKILQKKVDNAEAITAISSFVKKDIQKYINCKGKDIEVIYNGVKDSSNDKQKAMNIHFPFLFSIGAFSEKKNFLSIIQMMKFLPNLHLVIAGNTETNYGKICKEYILKNRINNVQLIGKVDDEEKNWLYANCTAFVFPSLFEGFGMPIIEALYFGKRVISSSETSLSEIGGTAVDYFTNFNPIDMANDVNKSLQNDNFSPNDVKLFAKQYNWDICIGKYIEVYSKVLNK